MAMKLGRRRPAHPPRRYLHHYLTGAGLPDPPPSVDYSGSAMPALSNIYDNDTLGDCVIACGWHLLGTWTGNAGDLVVGTNQQIINDYGYIGGYVPGDPSTDNGCDEVTALNYWQAHGFSGVPGSNLAGWLAVDAANQTLLMQAIDLFEGLILTLELPNAYTQPMPSGPDFTWDVAGPPNPREGHCIYAYGYSAEGPLIDTWALVPATMTWPAVAKYCVNSGGGGAYIAISQEALNKAQQKAPNGLDWATMVADFDQVGGNIPVPNPGPSPTPGPTPPPLPPSTQGWWDTSTMQIHLPVGWAMRPASHAEGPTVVIHPAIKAVDVPKGWNIV